uniref:Uncharacterized protein n=1 Tax=Gopherus agassizii TaxID=38772 RepID=A0A452HUR8_9SAUR
LQIQPPGALLHSSCQNPLGWPDSKSLYKKKTQKLGLSLQNWSSPLLRHIVSCVEVFSQISPILLPLPPYTWQSEDVQALAQMRL